MNWAVDLVQDHLKFLAELEKDFGPATALLKFGQAFEATDERPAWLKRGVAKQCYKNATQVMLNRDDVFYAEGFAIDLDMPIPLEHAWLVDANGHVIDPTWDRAEDHLYFGVVFERDAIQSAMVSNGGDAGILTDYKLMRRLGSTADNFSRILVPSFTSPLSQPGRGL